MSNKSNLNAFFASYYCQEASILRYLRVYGLRKVRQLTHHNNHNKLNDNSNRITPPVNEDESIGGV